MLAIIQEGTIGLGPDEAQYWTWSRQLDWGYYSKPPGIAWQIWSTTQLLGDTELGVRASAVILAFLISLSVYFLGKACGLSDRAAFWAGMIIAWTPMGILSSLLATTDGGLVLFWTLACMVLAKSFDAPRYLVIGCLVGAGALFKWPIYLFWLLIGLGMFRYPAWRSKNFFAGIAISLIGLLPSLYWNSMHEWATFRHVLATVAGGHAKTASIAKGNFFDFLGAQAALLSPVFFLLLAIAVAYLIRNREQIPPVLSFMAEVTIVIVAGYAGAALIQKIQGNWCVFAYPSGIVFLAWYWCDKRPKSAPWMPIGVSLSIFMTLFLLSIPLLQAYQLAEIPYNLNPFRHNVGWKNLGTHLNALGYDLKENFLFSDKYQTTSILSFYGSRPINRAYFFNLQGARRNQFSYWPSLKEEKLGKTGYFVLVEQEPQLSRLNPALYQSMLEPYFQQVDFMGIRPLVKENEKIVKGAMIFKCVNYNGQEPAESQIF